MKNKTFVYVILFLVFVFTTKNHYSQTIVDSIKVGKLWKEIECPLSSRKKIEVLDKNFKKVQRISKRYPNWKLAHYLEYEYIRFYRSYIEGESYKFLYQELRKEHFENLYKQKLYTKPYHVKKCSQENENEYLVEFSKFRYNMIILGSWLELLKKEKSELEKMGISVVEYQSMIQFAYTNNHLASSIDKFETQRENLRDCSCKNILRNSIYLINRARIQIDHYERELKESQISMAARLGKKVEPFFIDLSSPKSEIEKEIRAGFDVYSNDNYLTYCDEKDVLPLIFRLQGTVAPRRSPTFIGLNLNGNDLIADQMQSAKLIGELLGGGSKKGSVVLSVGIPLSNCIHTGTDNEPRYTSKSVGFLDYETSGFIDHWYTCECEEKEKLQSVLNLISTRYKSVQIAEIAKSTRWKIRASKKVSENTRNIMAGLLGNSEEGDNSNSNYSIIQGSQHCEIVRANLGSLVITITDGGILSSNVQESYLVRYFEKRNGKWTLWGESRDPFQDGSNSLRGYADLPIRVEIYYSSRGSDKKKSIIVEFHKEGNYEISIE